MAFELNLFGSPLQVGTFDFFDLMDTVVAPQQEAQLYTFTAKPAAQGNDFAGSPLKTAA